VNATTQRVVDGLDEMYTRRSSKAHGHFSDDADNYPTAGYFDAYFRAGGFGDFHEFTGHMMHTLLAKARRVPNAGAGHVFFAHFERDGREFMLIAIVNEKLGAALTNAFEVEDVRHLDLEGFRFAGRVDMTSWRAGEDRYIGFLRGRGDVAEYFKEFLACISSMTEKRSTEELVTALRSYADDQRMDVAERDGFLARAKATLDETARSGEQVDFQTLANAIVPGEPERLAEFLGDPDRGLGDGFTPNRRVLGTLVKFRARTPLWSIEIDRAAIAEGAVVFDPENRTLTITQVPDEFAEELLGEYEARAED
jgi:nucleoid-associated protein